MLKLLGSQQGKALRYAVLVFAGILQALSTAWPWGNEGQAFGSVQIVAMAVALLFIGVSQTAQPHEKAKNEEAKRKLPIPSAFWQGFRRGWCFATAWLTATFWWLFVSLHTYGGMPAVFAALSVLILAAFLALYYGIALGVWHCWAARLPKPLQGLLFVSLWLLAELCRGVFFTGFPWGAVGYAHIDSALSGYAPWLGVYGIGALASACAFACAVVCSAVLQIWFDKTEVLPPFKKWHGMACLAVIALVVGLGSLLQQVQLDAVQKQAASAPHQEKLDIVLLQGNVPQDEKFQMDGGLERSLEWYWLQMQTLRADLIVLPESALPVMVDMLPDGYWQSLQERLEQTDKPQAALIGVFAGSSTVKQGYANAAVGIATGGAKAIGTQPQVGLDLPALQQTQYHYAKHHLVPFGEFVPLGFQWFMNMMRIPLTEQMSGALGQPRMLLKGERLQPNICYEDLFGEELAKNFIDPATAPTILINMSNIAWFGDTVAISQHRHISRMRAKEFARPMLRATNTGATAVIDATGQVLQEMPRLTQGVLRTHITGNHGEPTFFAWWAARLGLWPLWIWALLGAAWPLYVARRRDGLGQPPRV